MAFDFRDPPGGKCEAAQCDLDAVVELNLQGQDLGGLVLVKVCGVHQMGIARQLMDHGDDDEVITETCEIEFRGKRLRVEDGRLIREEGS